MTVKIRVYKAISSNSYCTNTNNLTYLQKMHFNYKPMIQQPIEFELMLPQPNQKFVTFAGCENIWIIEKKLNNGLIRVWSLFIKIVLKMYFPKKILFIGINPITSSSQNH